MTETIDNLIGRVESILQRLEALLPNPGAEPAWNDAIAFRWLGAKSSPPLRAIAHPRMRELVPRLHEMGVR